jgi:O-antigen ligase
MGMAAFVLFVLVIFFAKGGKAPGLIVSPVVAGALLSLRSGAAVEAVRRTSWFWLFLAFLAVWVFLGATVGETRYQASDLLNMALLGGFLLFAAEVSRVLSTRQILWTIAVVGAVSAFLSIIVHVVRAPHLMERLIPLGRAGNPIPGAGGVAIALIAAAALWREQGIRRGQELALALALAIPLIAALVWTQSRAPIVAVCLALPLAFGLYRRGAFAVLIACVGTWLAVTGLILFEDPLKTLVCGFGNGWCRPSYRTEIWDWVLDQIAAHPVLGSGPSFRFSKEWMSHAHNGLLGTALYFGLVGLAAFGVMIAIYARNLIRQPDGALRFFGLASLIFSFGYMGADLSNPFAFFNTHYLFMWLPIFLVSVRGEQAPAASSPDSLQRM